MDDYTNSDDSLYNFLINDCGRSPAAAAAAVDRCKTASDKQRLRRRRYRCPCPRSKNGGGGVETTAATSRYDRPLDESCSSFDQPATQQRQQRQQQEQQQQLQLQQQQQQQLQQQQQRNGRTQQRRATVNRCRERPPSREPCRCGHAQPPAPAPTPTRTPPPQPQPYRSPYAVALSGRWVRTVADWAWDKKWHFVATAVSFALGMYFEDYCQCLYYYAATDDECGLCGD